MISKKHKFRPEYYPIDLIVVNDIHNFTEVIYASFKKPFFYENESQQFHIPRDYTRTAIYALNLEFQQTS